MHAASSFRIIAGLGNPGEKYARTFHNAGFFAVEELRKLWQAPPFREDKRAGLEWSRAESGIYLVRPRAYMNLSGPVIRKALRKFNLEPADLLLIHDDSDLPLGAFRLTVNRGAAGHKGVLSVYAALRSRNFTRLRLGVREKPGSAGAFVLKPMSAAAAAKLHSALSAAYEKSIAKNTPSGSALTSDKGRLTA